MRPAEEVAALREMREVRAAGDVDTEKRIARAVEDVMELGISLSNAKRNRNVPEPRLRAALAEKGWAPRRVRQNDSRSRAKQLPSARSDNQA